MKRIVCAAAVAITAMAQQPAAAPAFRMETTNEQAAVDIDRFIGNPLNTPVHISHGTLLIHTILRSGDPYKPGSNGAVLEYRRDLTTATLLPLNKTPLVTLPDEHFFIVKSGQGTLDDGKQSWDLKEGIAILAPPNVAHRFTNTSDKPLEMIMLRWTATGQNPGNALTVRDTNLLGYCEENAHWNNTSKCIFSAADGLFQNERMFIVMLDPWAMGAPHTHGPGTEEIWTKLTPGTAVMLMGSELREMPENSAYLVPPTGITQHANLNLSKDKTEWWLYVARGAANQARPAGNPANTNVAPGAAEGPARAANQGGRGRPQNPNISRDVKDATIAGKPLK